MAVNRAFANIAFISDGANRSIGDDDPSIYLAKVKLDVLRSQCIPLDKRLWRIEQAEPFWDARRELLAESFNDFLATHFEGRRLG